RHSPMPTTDTSESGLEALIVRQLTEGAEGDGHIEGDREDYDREYAVDLGQLLKFLLETQPDAVENLGLGSDGPSRQKFLHRLQGQVAKNGIVDVLRKGVKH